MNPLSNGANGLWVKLGVTSCNAEKHATLKYGYRYCYCGVGKAPVHVNRGPMQYIIDTVIMRTQI